MRLHSVAVAAVVCVTSACANRSSTARETADAAPAPAASAVAPVIDASAAEPVTKAATADASAELNPDDACSRAEPRAGKSIGHTSTVFKLELEGGKKVAWKPNAKKVRGRYKGEIAGYRLAVALGLPNVLPACPRSFDRDRIGAVLAANADATSALANEAIVEDGVVHGAAIAWFDGLTFWPLEKEPLRSEMHGWLASGGNIPSAKVELARQTSTLVAFDFITGNWDRYSGENVGIDKAGELVLYIDNDAGFMETLPKGAAARSEANLRAVDRFSKSFIEGIRRLDDARLARVFGEEAPGRPLLSPAITAIVSQRVKKLLAVVDQKIRDHGEPATLYFR